MIMRIIDNDDYIISYSSFAKVDDNNHDNDNHDDYVLMMIAHDDR